MEQQNNNTDNRRKRKQRVYISGPMSSATKEEFQQNVTNFHAAARWLKAAGYKPINPANVLCCRHPRLYGLMERWLGKDRAYRTVLAYDLLLLAVRADSVCQIQRWYDSRGARIEGYFAFRTAIPRSHVYIPSRDLLLSEADLQRQKKEKRRPKHDE